MAHLKCKRLCIGALRKLRFHCGGKIEAGWLQYFCIVSVWNFPASSECQIGSVQRESRLAVSKQMGPVRPWSIENESRQEERGLADSIQAAGGQVGRV